MKYFFLLYFSASFFGKKGDLPCACPPCPRLAAWLAYERTGRAQALASPQIWDLSQMVRREKLLQDGVLSGSVLGVR